jgi:hypothetical protein
MSTEADVDTSLLFGPPEPDFVRLLYGPLDLHVTLKEEGRAVVRFL